MVLRMLLLYLLLENSLVSNSVHVYRGLDPSEHLACLNDLSNVWLTKSSPMNQIFLIAGILPEIKM